MNDTPSWMGDWSTWSNAAPAPTDSSAAIPLPPATDPAHAQYLREIAAEAIGWQPVGAQTYMHLGAPQDVQVIDIVGVADASMAGLNVVLLNY